jgi:hypothetical protein
MQGARALVFPSVWYENFPVTIAEAFACGLPVVGSRIGAIAEIVEDGRTGYLFPPRDAAGLASTLSRVWQDESATAAMGRTARAAYESLYTADANYPVLLSVYEAAIERFRASAGPDMNALGRRSNQWKHPRHPRERIPAKREPEASAYESEVDPAASPGRRR